MAQNFNSATLSGLKVIDLSDESASLASRLLGDAGAEVIKVEPPGGDSSRRLGPFRNNRRHPEESLSFWYRNQNKLGLTLDFENKNDLATLRHLCRHADVLVESFTPGYLAGFGLDYHILNKANPALVYASVTGFGQTGPYRDYKSADIIAAAAGGQMFVCGTPDTPPLKHYGQQPYNLASFFTAIGIQLALQERRLSGLGQYLDVSLFESVVATMDNVLPRYCYMERGQIPGRTGDHHWTGAFGIVPCRTGNLLISPIFERATLAELMAVGGQPGNLDEKRWNDQRYVRYHMDEAMAQISRWSRHQDVDELFEMGQLMRIPWAKIASIKDVVDCSHLKERKFFVEVPHATGIGNVSYPGDLARFSKTTLRHQRAPLLGEHNSRLESIRESWENAKPAPTPATTTPPQNILNGLRILDFSRVLAGPYATRMLSDFGAEVIKVQSGAVNNGVENNNNGYFYAWNRNKLGITLNMGMGHPEATELALKLASKCDVVLENFTPRVMANWGMQYESLRKVKPDIIMISLSGMGQDGPWRDFAAYGPTIEALTGITALTAFDAEHPLGTGIALSDHVGGIVGVWAILTALEHRARTGEGQYIDISEHEAMCSLMGPALLDGTTGGGTLTPPGNDAEWDEHAFYGCYPCRGKERWCVMAVRSDAEWRVLANIIDPGGNLAAAYPDAASRREHAAAIHPVIERWTRQHSPKRVTETLQAAGVAAAPVNNARDLVRDPHLKARNFFFRRHHRSLGNTLYEASPIRLSRNPARPPHNAPRFGQHNDYVFGELLGLSKAEISRLKTARIIG
jgi:crotonobetainyl-CoA:carnitine CoA-transferase CaiB-like acyl-CoA transferase